MDMDSFFEILLDGLGFGEKKPILSEDVSSEYSYKSCDDSVNWCDYGNTDIYTFLHPTLDTHTFLVCGVVMWGGGTRTVAVHSEAIWGVMIALVFFAIFEPHDENKSWWGRPKCQKKIFFKNIFEIFLRKIKYLKNIFHISKEKQHFWALWWKWKL